MRDRERVSSRCLCLHTMIITMSSACDYCVGRPGAWCSASASLCLLISRQKCNNTRNTGMYVSIRLTSGKRELNLGHPRFHCVLEIE
jgi:hypothetical protein